MSEIRSPYDDEIDLFELFAVLWDGKWFIGVFVAVALSISGGVLLVKMRFMSQSSPMKRTICRHLLIKLRPCLILGLCFMQKIHLIAGNR